MPFAVVLKLNQGLKNPNLIYPNQDVNTPLDTGQGNDNNASNGANDGQSSNVDNTNASDRGESAEQANEVLKLVNAERAKQGLRALTLDGKLNNIATIKAKDMAQNNYFSHTSPNYGSPFEMLRAFGVTNYKSAGENIAMGQQTPESVMHSWMNSSGHRANILNANYTHLGVGYYKQGQQGTYWVQLFTQQ